MHYKSHVAIQMFPSGQDSGQDSGPDCNALCDASCGACVLNELRAALVPARGNLAGKK